jgi:glycosyltransferase involved in cell wall biosynthesis
MTRTLLHVFSTFNIGGPQTRFAQIANRFGRRYRHRLISMDGGIAATNLLSKDLDFELLSIEVRKRATLRNTIRFRRMLIEVSPHLLTTSNWGSIEWAVASASTGIHHMHTEDGFGPEEKDKRFLRRNLARRIALRKSLVVVPSKTLQETARKNWGLTNRHLLYLPNGVDLERFSVPPVQQTPNRPFVIGTIATLRSEKNLRRLVDAFNQARSEMRVKLVIVGDGPERAALESYASNSPHAGDIRFEGYSSSPEAFLSSFDLFAMSSDTEQMPISLLEAMAAARPVVATDVGDVRHMLSEENRPYLAGRNSSELAAKIVSLLSAPELSSKIGAANRDRVTRTFNQEQMFEVYGALWDGKFPN